MRSVLEFDSLEKKYESHQILSGIYMRCETGEVTGLLGRNGSGKSTLMKIVFGSLQADYKSVRINGKSLGNDYLRQRLISYLPQENLIPPFLSIQESIKLFGISADQIIRDFPEAREFIKLKPRELSGGHLRLVETLIILKSPALFCILDEPFSGLMPVHIEKLKEIITKEKMHKGIIITDHLYRHVTEISDRLYVLANGKTYPVTDAEQLVARGYISEL